MRIIHNIQHRGEREIDVWGGTCLYAGDMNFQSPQKTYEHHRSVSALLRPPPDNTSCHKRWEDTRHNEGLGRGVTEIHYVVPTSFISTRSRDGAPGVPALDQRAPPFSPLLCESVVRCEPGPKRRSINEYRGWTSTARSQAPEPRSP